MLSVIARGWKLPLRVVGENRKIKGWLMACNSWPSSRASDLTVVTSVGSCRWRLREDQKYKGAVPGTRREQKDTTRASELIGRWAARPVSMRRHWGAGSQELASVGGCPGIGICSGFSWAMGCCGCTAPCLMRLAQLELPTGTMLLQGLVSKLRRGRSLWNNA